MAMKVQVTQRNGYKSVCFACINEGTPDAKGLVLFEVSEVDESCFKNLYLIVINIHTLYWMNYSFHACLICGVQRMNTQKARFQLQRPSAMWSCCIWL